MKVDIKQLENLNYLFLQVMGQIFLAPGSSDPCNEMTGAQKKILYLIGLHGPQKMTEIARQIGVTMSGATGIVDKLVKAGHVAREEHPSDRRVILVTLTDPGKEVLHRIQAIHERRLEEVLEHLDEAKRKQLIGAFETIQILLSEIQHTSDKKAVTE